MPEKIVVALGGNALQSGDSAPTAEAQLEVVRQTAQHISEISRRGYEMAVVHGNGPEYLYSGRAFVFLCGRLSELLYALAF